MSLFIRNARYVLSGVTDIQQYCDILVEGNRIARVGQNLPQPDGTGILDASGCAVLPGLINPHTHLYQNFLKGISQDIPLVPWCNRILFPTVGVLRDTSKTNPRIPYLWSMLSTIEMIKGGITCCIDMDVTHRATLQAWQEAGFRGVLAYTLTNKWVPAELRAAEDEMRQTVLDFIDEYHRPKELTQVFLAPSTVFLCDDDLMKWVRDQATLQNTGVQIHVSETAGEVEESLQETGMTPVERLSKLGLLNERLSAVHCCHVNDEEITTLANSGAAVVHCPKSNMKLADGIAPVNKMIDSGITVSVATDGCASNDLLDMWEEMRAGLMLARVSQNNAAALSPQDAIRMATIDAAKACRIDAGEIKAGKLADLIVLDLNSAHLQPVHDVDLCNMLVFCARAADVRDTIIDGHIVMRARTLTTIDETKIIEEAAQLDQELFRRRQDYSFQNEP